jgi:hypothetical protein
MWAGQKGGHKPTPIIHGEHYRKIYHACKKEIIEITGRVNAMRAALHANLSHPTALAPEPTKRTAFAKGKPHTNPYKDLGVLLATLHHRYPKQILTSKWVDALSDRSLASAINKRGITNIAGCFYPSATDLVPIVFSNSLLCMTRHGAAVSRHRP